MSTWAVFKSNEGQLSVKSVGKYTKFVCTFEADAQCDFVHQMLDINEDEGFCDSYWTKIGEQVERDGL